MLFRFKKHLAILFVTLITVPQVSFGQIASVVSDPSNMPFNIGSMVQEILQATKEYSLDVVAFQLAAMAGSKMSNAIFNNASGGASGDGESQIISNFTTHLQKIEDTERKKFITALEADSVNNPYAAKIARNLTIQGQQSSQPNSSSVPKFNLDKVIGPNWEQFKTDARVGGWNGYIALALPQNNPYGAELLAAEELARKVSIEKEAEKLKLTSPGIDAAANSKQCALKFNEYQQGLQESGQKKLAQIQSNNAKIKAQIDSLENQIKTLSSGLGGNEEKISQLQAQIGDLTEQITVSTEDFNRSSDSTSITKTGIKIEATDECIEEVITNPASTAASLLDSAATYGIEKSKTSNGFGDVFLSLFMTMAQSFIRGGLSSWRNSNGGYQASMRTDLFVAGPEDQVDARGNIKPINDQPFQIVDLVNDFPYAYTLTKQDINKTITTLTELRKTPEYLAQLDICVPGPDYKYQERFEKYFQEKLQIPYGVYSRSEEDWERAREEAKIKDLEYSKKLAVSEMKSIVNDPAYNIPGSTVFKSAVSEFSTKKISFDQARRSLIEKNSALSGILSVGQQIKQVLNKIAFKEKNMIFYQSENMQVDKIIVSSKDWGDTKDKDGKPVATTATGTSKAELVTWAFCMELPREKYNALVTKKATATQQGSDIKFTKSDEFTLEKYRSCYQ